MQALHMKDGESMSKYSKDVYDAIPVYYCKQCLSLRIMDVPGIEDTDFCDNCNSTNIEQTDIQTWERLYQERYGRKYLDEFKY